MKTARHSGPVLLREVWPEDEQVKVFACLEGREGNQWVLKDNAASEDAKTVFNLYKNCEVKDCVVAGSRVVYIYMDADKIADFAENDADQMTLFEENIV